jgi:fatty acid desaturase
MSIQEHQSGQAMLPEVELPEFKAHAPVFSRWERFKRQMDQEWRPTLAYAVVVNIILLVAILALIWVSVAYGGFIFNPPTMLGLFSLPILFTVYDGLRLMEQEKKLEKERENKTKLTQIN